MIDFTALRVAQSRGKKYEIALIQQAPDDFKVEAFTHGRSQWTSSGFRSRKTAEAKFEYMVWLAREYDGIRYIEREEG